MKPSSLPEAGVLAVPGLTERCRNEIGHSLGLPWIYAILSVGAGSPGLVVQGSKWSGSCLHLGWVNKLNYMFLCRCVCKPHMHWERVDGGRWGWWLGHSYNFLWLRKVSPSTPRREAQAVSLSCSLQKYQMNKETETKPSFRVLSRELRSTLQ